LPLLLASLVGVPTGAGTTRKSGLFVGRACATIGVMARARDFEVSFGGLLETAGTLPDLVAESAASLPGNEQIRGGDFPRSTVWRLQQLADVQFASVLGVLGDPLTSPTAHALVRGLLELWAHNYFIFADGAESEWRCGALQLELGMNLSIEHALEAATRSYPDEFSNDLTVVKERVRQINELKAKEECAGKRDDGNVETTLQRIAQKVSGMEWLVPLWKSSSLALHQLSIDLIVKDLGGGRIGVSDPLPSQRASYFDHALTAYVNASELYLAIMRADADAIQREYESVRGSPFFQSAQAGDYDAK
jgi:hypothetical protein